MANVFALKYFQNKNPTTIKVVKKEGYIRNELI
jgi:hypothetical protein